MVFTHEKWVGIEPLLPLNSIKLTENAEFVPVFFEDGFAYKRDIMQNREKNWEYTFVDPDTGEQCPLFDHEKLAAALSLDKNHLEITVISRKNGVLLFKNNKQTYSWAENVLTTVCEKEGRSRAVSPNGKMAIYVENGNIFLEKGEKNAVQLTFDGEKHFGYGIRNEEDNNFIADMLAGIPPKAGVLWSPDNRRFLTWKLDLRRVNEYHLVQNAPESGKPIHYSYKYALPGDEHIPMFTVWLGDSETGKLMEAAHEPMPMLSFDIDALLKIHLGWSDGGETPLFCHMHRNHKQADYYKIDAKSGECTLLLSDKSQTFLFSDFLAISGDTSIFHYCDELKALFALTEASGYSQIIRVDDGGIHPITEGQFVVTRWLAMDGTHIYFSACGREKGTLPLHNYTYRVPINGGEIELISRRRGNHQVFFSPSCDYFITSVSTCDQPQAAVLCALDGTEKHEISVGSCAELENCGMTYPIAFCEKGADGVTDIHGIIVMPPSFEAGKKYPVIDYYYGGNQTSNVPQTFVGYLNCGFVSAFAKLEMVAVVIDGMGTPGRGKVFHDACCKNMGACAGMDDHEAVIKALCNKFPFMDADRIGVWGHSGGGFGAYQCMVKKPDFYKCAVASGGNHLQELYVWDWAERYMAGSEGVEAQSAEGLAANLQGKLLLIHGELDDNVHPSGTMRIVKALIAADKDFDMLIMPNKHHLLRPDPYFQRKLFKFMTENL